MRPPGSLSSARRWPPPSPGCSLVSQPGWAGTVVVVVVEVRWCTTTGKDDDPRVASDLALPDGRDAVHPVSAIARTRVTATWTLPRARQCRTMGSVSVHAATVILGPRPRRERRRFRSDMPPHTPSVIRYARAYPRHRPLPCTRRIPRCADRTPIQSLGKNTRGSMSFQRP